MNTLPQSMATNPSDNPPNPSCSVLGKKNALPYHSPSMPKKKSLKLISDRPSYGSLARMIQGNWADFQQRKFHQSFKNLQLGSTCKRWHEPRSIATVGVQIIKNAFKCVGDRM